MFDKSIEIIMQSFNTILPWSPVIVPALIAFFKKEIGAWLTARSIYLDREFDDHQPNTPDFCQICGPDGKWSDFIIFQYTRPKPFRRMLAKIKPEWGMAGVYYARLMPVSDKNGRYYELQYRHESLGAWAGMTKAHMPAARKKLWRDRIKNERSAFDTKCMPWGGAFSLSRYGAAANE